MIDRLTRREVIGAGAALLAGPTVLSAQGPAKVQSRVVAGRQRERLERWRFHLGHAADVERDFGFGRDQRTFAKAGQAADSAMPKFDDSRWDEVIVPHDWAVALPFAQAPEVKGSDRGAAHGFKAIGRDFPQNSIGWYRTPIAITAADRGRRIWLEFDGVLRDAVAFVNGYDVIRNESGYAPFRVRIDEFLDYDGGPNVATVRADATPGEGSLYEGAGIYRHVELVRADPLHIPQWGVVVRCQVATDGAVVSVATDVLNGSEAPISAVLRQALTGSDGAVVANLPDVPLSLAGGEQRTFERNASLRAPRLWSLDERNLYQVESALFAGDL